MEVVKIDKKWRVMLPKRLRARAGIPRNAHLEVRARPGTLVMNVIRPKKRPLESDPLIQLLRKPISVKKRVTREELERIEDEMWLP